MTITQEHYLQNPTERSFGHEAMVFWPMFIRHSRRTKGVSIPVGRVFQALLIEEHLWDVCLVNIED